MLNLFRRKAAPAAVFLVFLSSFTANTDAALILQPVAAATNVIDARPPENAINQSGLSSPYTSLVTDFDAYIESGPTAAHGFGENVWSAAEGTHSGNFEVELGGTYEINAIALWTLAYDDPSTIRRFNISLSNDPFFTVATTFTDFVAFHITGDVLRSAAQVFEFPATSAAYLRLEILDTWSETSYTAGFNEIAMRVVPEPGTAMLFGLGLSFWAGLRRRASAAQ